MLPPQSRILAFSKGTLTYEAAMTTYKAPTRDINFVLNEVLDYQTHYQSIPGGEEAT
ncbi:MAG: acyl-CoA dehydrogenase N-terminal domain-containing protein, partial [Spongiibacter sp.]|nr:acyl-CoA dehydrogenase N-terminal domain-containing protein [Spongiibacter sp.]